MANDKIPLMSIKDDENKHLYAYLRHENPIIT